MIDIKTYLESGIIESYVWGLASPEETEEVNQLLLVYPEIRAAIDSCSETIENFSLKNGITPNPTIKPFLMATIDFMDRMEKGEQPTSAPNIDEHSQIADFDQWLNRPDMFLPEGTTEPYAKIISYTPTSTTAIVWLKDMAPQETHHDVYENFLIVEGSCDITIGATVHQLIPGNVLSIPLHEVHSVKITSSIPCKIILQRIAA